MTVETTDCRPVHHVRPPIDLRRMTRNSLLRSGALATAVLLSGCLYDPCSSFGVSTLVLVNAGDLTLGVGESVHLTATDSWCSDRHQAPANVHWSLARAQDASVLSLNATTGDVTARAPGTAVISGKSDRTGATITVTLTVR